MCGIAGLVSSKHSRNELEKVLLGMRRALHHRGPDDHGTFMSRDGAAGLVNTRLAILDLSAAGHQPMTSNDGRYTISFNGEIYNFDALRKELQAEGKVFTSHCDTEVILKLYARHGPECVEKLGGMFALAVWDEQERLLFLARDPLGIKPLYYYESGGQLIFASELRTLLESGLVPRKLCGAALTGYLLSGAVPEPWTLVENVQMLPAGHYLIVKGDESQRVKFWDLHLGDHAMDHDEAVAVTRDALKDSVERHHVSDVPVGVFLSGGIDSTAIVALSSKISRSDVRTFSISFDNPRLNEGTVAQRTAAHFGTRHTDWRLDSAAAKSLLKRFLDRFDQPSVDGFNTFCVSKLVHDQGLKVVLSGLGGDEIFGGYQSFTMIPRMLGGSRRLNRFWPLRHVASRGLQAPFASPRFNRLGEFLMADTTTKSAYSAMRGIFTAAEAAQLLPRYLAPESESSARREKTPLQPTIKDEVSYLEITRYMRNQLLRDSDVMSMAWGLELRVPFVDRTLVEAVARIPATIRLAPGKQLLLDAVPEIPEWVRNRPKQGFTFPFGDWIAGEWRDVFRRIELESPVRLKNWYRTWCLFALENFLEKNRIERVAARA